MSSTRVKNSNTNYGLERIQNTEICKNRVHTIRNYAAGNHMPDAGILTGHMPMNAIASNAIDIETQLRGIGSSDLTTQRPTYTPTNYTRDNISFFERPEVMLPDPLVIQNKQRPIIP